MTDDEDRIRRKAYELWVAQGQPDGKAEENWRLARDLVAKEDASSSTPAKSAAARATGVRKAASSKAAPESEAAGSKAGSDSVEKPARKRRVAKG